MDINRKRFIFLASVYEGGDLSPSYTVVALPIEKVRALSERCVSEFPGTQVEQKI